jgi:methylglutaconyl-CoA hydratase
MNEPVHLAIQPPRATVTLNRPEKRNALNSEVVRQLSEALKEAEANDTVRAVVLTGAGSAFCAGADLGALRAMQSASEEENLADSQALAALFKQIVELNKPVIAGINGHAIAGGSGLVAVCDFSIAVEGAKFGLTEVRIGFVPAIVGYFVLHRVGGAAARDLLLRGRLISASEAAAMGLINRVVPADELDEAVDSLVRELATETSPTAVAMTKRLLADLQGMGLEEAMQYAARLNTQARGTEDCKAGIAAFLNKTAPPWNR